MCVLTDNVDGSGVFVLVVSLLIVVLLSVCIFSTTDNVVGGLVRVLAVSQIILVVVECVYSLIMMVVV